MCRVFTNYGLYRMKGLAKRLLPLLVASALGSPAALADVILSIQTNTPNPMQGDTGDSFDVLLTNTGPSEVDIAAFSFGVFTTDTDISFTEADVSTDGPNPYIFFGNSFDQIYLGGVISNPSPVGEPSLPAQFLTASDVGNAYLSYTAVAAGETVDLGTVLFDVDPNAAIQSFTVSFDMTLFPNPPGGYQWNNLSDENGNAVNIDSFQSGTFNVTEGVPEPSPLLLLPIGLTCLWMFSRPGRSRRARARGTRS